MSRAFHFDVQIESGLNPGDDEALSGWLTYEFENINQFGDTAFFGFDETLYGGLGDDEFATQVAQDIFAALGRKVPVRIASTYLERDPDEVYKFGFPDEQQEIETS